MIAHAATRAFEMIGVPIDCTGYPGGTELSPNALRELGLARLPGIFDSGDLPLSIRNPKRDPDSGIIGISEVCHVTNELRRHVAEILARGALPLLVGGCCTQIIGAIAGARDHFGEIGLAYADGHLDLYDGETSPTGEAADIPLAVLLGCGPRRVLELIGPKSPISVGNTVLLGYRDYEAAKRDGSLLPEDLGSEFEHFTAARLRSDGLSSVARRVLQKMEGQKLHFWLHIDVDILDQDICPATDYLMPGGLTWDEFDRLLQPLGQSPWLAGIAVSCYNPEKDPKRECAAQLVSAMRGILAR